MAHILVFGDSISYGAWDREGGWVQRLRMWLDERFLSKPDFYFLTYNLSVSGDVSGDVLERFEFETKQRTDEEKNQVIIFAIGGNDAQFITDQNRCQTSEKIVNENIQKLIILARKYASNIIFVGLAPTDESKTVPIPWCPDKSYKNEHIQKYNNLIKSICAKNKIPFIEIFEKLIKTDYKTLLEDGVHPNTEGHKKMFEIIKEFLIKNKMI